MDEWEKFNETLSPEKEEFYSNINMEDITDENYMRAEGICKNFEIKNSGEYIELYLNNDTLLVADVFENFRKMSLKIYHFDPAKFLSAPGLAWQADLKKTKIKLKLFTNIDTLLMVKKGIRRGMCHAIYRYAKSNNKFTKDYDKNKESSYIKYWDVNCLYDWAMSQTLPTNKFKWVRDTCKFNENFIKNYNHEGYILS